MHDVLYIAPKSISGLGVDLFLLRLLFVVFILCQTALQLSPEIDEGGSCLGDLVLHVN